MFPNPKQYSNITKMVAERKLAKPPCISGFEQVLFGNDATMNSFGVLHNGKLYTCVHQWSRTAVYMYRRFQASQRDCFYPVSNRDVVLPGDDLTVSTVGTAMSTIPILEKLESELIITPPKELPTSLQLTCLLDGQIYKLKHQAMQRNSKPVGVLMQKSYPGLSGTGFVDQTGRLYLLSGGPDDGAEMTIITPVWRHKLR